MRTVTSYRRHQAAAAAGIALGLVLASAGAAATAAPAVPGGPTSAPPGATARAVRVCPEPASGTVACTALIRTDIAPTRTLAPDTDPAGYGPVDLHRAYQLPEQAASTNTTVAIVDSFDDPTAESDLAKYRSQFGLPACTTANGCFSKVNQTGATKPLPPENDLWALEIALDLDMVSAICQDCHILLVEANSGSWVDQFTAVDYAAAHAKYVSLSFAGAEYSGETTDDKHLNHPGVLIAASTGDGGAAANFPATSQYVLAVGGTSLSPANNDRGWTETAWGDAGAGCSAYEPKPSWQTASNWQHLATGCGKRATSDVSAVADPATGVAVYSTTGSTGWVVEGGTSASTPIVAATYALAGTPKAGDNPASYPYFHGSLYDVTSGSDGGCGTRLCDATTGWDGPTGLGTPNGAAAFTVPKTHLTVGNFGTDQGWTGDRAVRAVADATGDSRADLIGFGDDGVWLATADANGSFVTPTEALEGAFGYNQGWRPDRHVRLLGDVTGDGRADVVAFGDDGVWTAVALRNRTFDTPRRVIATTFGANQGWRVNDHPRMLADITGDGRADIVGFGDDGVWTAVSNGDGTFATPTLALSNFGFRQGWDGQRPRMLADITGDGRADIVGFGNDGVWVAAGNGDGRFTPAWLALQDFGYNQGWRTDKHPRLVGDITGDGRADIVAFSDDKVYTATVNPDGTFWPVRFVLTDFVGNQGWTVGRHTRLLADVTGDGRDDIVAAGDDGLWTAVSTADGNFAPPQMKLDTFGTRQGWSADLTQISAADIGDITADRRGDDVVGFGTAGVYVALASGNGGFW